MPPGTKTPDARWRPCKQYAVWDADDWDEMTSAPSEGAAHAEGTTADFWFGPEIVARARTAELTTARRAAEAQRKAAFLKERKRAIAEEAAERSALALAGVLAAQEAAEREADVRRTDLQGKLKKTVELAVRAVMGSALFMRALDVTATKSYDVVITCRDKFAFLLMDAGVSVNQLRVPVHHDSDPEEIVWGLMSAVRGSLVEFTGAWQIPTNTLHQGEPK